MVVVVAYALPSHTAVEETLKDVEKKAVVVAVELALVGKKNDERLMAVGPYSFQVASLEDIDLEMIDDCKRHCLAHHIGSYCHRLID